LKRWLSSKEAVEYTGFSVKTLKKLVYEGKIKGKKLCNRWRFDRESIDLFFEEKENSFVIKLVEKAIGGGK